MDPSEFINPSSGRLVPIEEGVWAFVPAPLPPELSWDAQLLSAVESASIQLGRLDGVAGRLPNPELLIRPFANREAVLSSRIEGTQAVLRDLLLFDVDREAEEAVPDVREVANYVAALRHGWKRKDELPIGLRFIRELHGRLMDGVRGHDQNPGEFRRLQNMIGARGCTLRTARYVPPPVPEMDSSLRALETYIHGCSPVSPLVSTALIHYQFEAIHPFLDGNGRVGRLLIPLLLNHRGVLSKPLLYLSAYFEAHRSAYYDHLLAVSQRGDWRSWLLFFMTGIEQQARDANDRAARLLDLREAFRAQVQRDRGSSRVVQLIDLLFQYPYMTIRLAAAGLGVTYPTAGTDVRRLVKAGVLKEITGRRRDRVFVAEEIVGLLE